MFTAINNTTEINKNASKIYKCCVLQVKFFGIVLVSSTSIIS